MAQYNLARILQKGEMVPKDLVQALRLYIQSAEQGHLQAQVAAGLCLSKLRSHSPGIRLSGKASLPGLRPLYFDNRGNLAARQQEKPRYLAQGTLVAERRALLDQYHEIKKPPWFQ